MKCLHLRKYGHDACDRPPHFQGGFAEYCVVDAGTSVFKLDESLSDEVAAPANCAVATIVAGWDAAQLQPGEHVLIQGAGALGCYAAAYAAYAGCRTIVVSDVDPRRLELARRFGATHCLDLSQVDGADAICDVKRLTDGFGVDCAMEVAGTPEALELGLASLRKGGRYVEIGCSFPGAHVSLDLSALLWNRLTILGVHNYDVRHLSGALSFLQATCSECPFVELSPTSYSLDEINAAILAAVEGRALRVAVRPR
jgi:threonine dehydrogenase-like Zn-dependent dehydrogenase